MKFLSSIGAIYLGIYLILPGCLCQLLTAFGVEISEGGNRVTSCEIRDLDDAFACHCNHHDLKKAELASVDESQANGPVHFVETLEQFVPLPLPRPRAGQFGSRAPPTERDLLSCRAYLGVFLI